MGDAHARACHAGHNGVAYSVPDEIVPFRSDMPKQTSVAAVGAGEARGAGVRGRKRTKGDHAAHVQGVGLNHAIFASEEGIFSQLRVKDGQKCPFKDSNVAAIRLTTPCRVSDDHPSLTLLAKILLPSASPPWHVSWEKALFAGKYPYVHLVPSNVGCRGQLGSVVTKSGLGQDKAGVAGVIGQ
jgi:hypothetical protein